MTPFLCLSRDVVDGQFRSTKVMGDSLVIWRKDGKLRAAPNICQHRGFPVACGQGTLPIKCPYHGLLFSGAGEFAVEESNGFAFLHDRPMATPELLQNMNALGFEFGSIDLAVRAPFELWMQNTMDPNHLRFVHRGFSSMFAEPMKPEGVWISESGRVSSYRMQVEADVVRRYEKLLGYAPAPYFFHAVVAPQLSITCFLGVFLSVETAEPTKEGCAVSTRFFTSKADSVPTTLLKIAMQRNRALLEEDQDVCERWALGRPWKTPTQWLPGEDRIRSYQQAMYRGQW